MPSVQEIDYTPPFAILKLYRNDERPLVANFLGQDLTGYSQWEVLATSPDGNTTVTVPSTFTAPRSLSIEPSAAMWALIISEGRWSWVMRARNPSNKLVHFVEGALIIEGPSA